MSRLQISLSILLGSLATLLIPACGGSAEELAATVVAQTAAANRTATAAVGEALAIALTENAPPPSDTPPPTITLTPTETFTPTSTPNPVAEVIEESATIREGPGLNYSIIQTVEMGTQLEIIGRSESGDWLAVHIDGEGNGWVPYDHISQTLNVDTLPIIEPPVPETITITVINNLDDRIFIEFSDPYRQFQINPGTTKTISLPSKPVQIYYRLAKAIQCGPSIYHFLSDVLFVPTFENFCSLPFK